MTVAVHHRGAHQTVAERTVKVAAFQPVKQHLAAVVTAIVVAVYDAVAELGLLQRPRVYGCFAVLIVVVHPYRRRLAAAVTPVVGKGAVREKVATAIKQTHQLLAAAAYKQVVADNPGSLSKNTHTRMVLHNAVADFKCWIVVDIGVGLNAYGGILYARPLDMVVLAACRQPDTLPLAGKAVVIAVVAHRAENHRLRESPVHVEGGAVVDPQAGTVGKIEFVASVEVQCLVAVDYSISYDNVRTAVVPVGTIYD